MASKIYRCHLIDDSDRISSYEQIVCTDDATATLKINELLAGSQLRSAELWDGNRLVGRWNVKRHGCMGDRPETTERWRIVHLPS